MRFFLNQVRLTMHCEFSTPPPPPPRFFSYFTLVYATHRMFFNMHTYIFTDFSYARVTNG